MGMCIYIDITCVLKEYECIYIYIYLYLYLYIFIYLQIHVRIYIYNYLHIYISIQAKEIITCVLKAVLYCHDQGICHRDLKPENILLTFDKESGKCIDLKLCDFGLSTKFNSSSVLTDFCGSPGFFAPEMIISGRCVCVYLCVSLCHWVCLCIYVYKYFCTNIFVCI
jgi:serine/threonine protein kinase